MDFSSAFKKDMAGKYAGVLPGFSAGISLGENLTTPLSQQASGMNSSSLNPYDNSDMKMLLDYVRETNSPEKREQELQAKLAFDKKQMELAFPYLMARKIPDQIAEGFGNAAMIRVLGARNASEAMNQTLASYPRFNLQATSFQHQK